MLDLPIILQIRLYQTQSYVLLSVFQWILCHMCGNTHTGKTQKNYFNSEGIIQMFLIPLNNVLISKRKNNIFLFDFYGTSVWRLSKVAHEQRRLRPLARLAILSTSTWP